MTTNRPNALARALIGCTLLLAAVAAPPAAAQDLGQTLGQAAGVPQIPAFLPDRYSVAKSQPLPIDGVWLVNTIRKKIRIEAGRAYAVDSWLHLFVLKVMPDMVVIKDVQRTGPGQYIAQDLPLMGAATMQLDAQGNLAVTVQGALGPARYVLQRLEAQYPEALSAEISAAGMTPVGIAPAPVTPLPAPITAPPAAPPPGSLPGMPGTLPPTTPAPAPAPAPVAPPADCKAIGIDPDTGATICA